MIMKKKCPTCGNIIESRTRLEYVAGVLEKQIIFECPCGFWGVGRPRRN